MSVMTPELERRLGAAVERMPAFPRSVQRVLELTRNINCLPREIVAVIEKDPVMTMKIFKVINSAYYALPNKITSVGQSVVYLGINTIKNLALAFAAVGVLPSSNKAGYDIQRYLLHSLSVAAVARQLAHQFGEDECDPGDCYVAGLLHDFGKIVFAQFLAEEFRTALAVTQDEHIALHVAERRVIGVDHGVVGALLAQRWAFAGHLVECIREHHNPAAPGTPMLDFVRAADQLVRQREIGDSGNPWRDGEAAAAPARLGGDIAELATRVNGLDKILAEATHFVQIAQGAAG